MEAAIHHRMAIAIGIIVAFLIVASARLAWGDGGFVSPYGRDVWEPAQIALIIHDRETGTEDLIIQASFRGNTIDFSWIIPVPSVPELAPVDPELFRECSRLTRTSSRRSGCEGPPGLLSRSAPGDVTIHDRQTVGIYSTLTVSADHPAALTDSLAAWGYLHSENRVAVEDALQYYIDRSWCFVAVKMDSTSFGDPVRAGGFWQGGIHPLRLTFPASRMVYPMRISALSADQWTEVLLYVASPHRMTFAGAVTEYASEIDARKLSVIQKVYPTLGQVLTRPCFLTKLRCLYRPEEIEADIAFERAPSNREYRMTQVGAPPGIDAALLTMAIVLVVRWRRTRRDSGGEIRYDPRDD